MRESPPRGLRTTEQDIKVVLDRLDGGEARQNGADGRRAPRFRYRIRAVIEFHGESCLAVPCRNLSRDGMAFLCGRFVYPGSRCAIRLVNEFDAPLTVEARVVRCRYVQGTAGIHEVGVAFASPIDIALFHPDATCVRVLLVDDDSVQQRLLEQLFTRTGAEVTKASEPEAALKLAQERSFDLIVVDFGATAFKGCELARTIRAKGYVRPITSVAALTQPQMEETCVRDGCSACHPLALSREALVRLVTQLKCVPVTSRFASDGEMVDLINQYVAGLQDQVRELEVAFSGGDNSNVVQLARRFAVLAEGAGFDRLVQVAEALETQINAGAELRTVRDGLCELVQLCLAARPASISRPAPPQPAEEAATTAPAATVEPAPTTEAAAAQPETPAAD